MKASSPFGLSDKAPPRVRIENICIFVRLTMKCGMEAQTLTVRRIPSAMRRAVLARDGEVCRVCGAGGDDIDHYRGTTVRLRIGFIVDPKYGGNISSNNLRVICSCCSEGMRGIYLPKPDRVHLLSQIRRATIDDQQAVLDWLLNKFGLVAKKRTAD